MIGHDVNVSINSQQLLEFLQWHVTSGHLAFMPTPDASSTADSELENERGGYRRMSVTIAERTTDDWQMIGYVANYQGYVNVMLGRELYKDGPTELVRMGIYGLTNLSVEPLQMLGLTHALIYEVASLPDLWSDWRKAE